MDSASLAVPDCEVAPVFLSGRNGRGRLGVPGWLPVVALFMLPVLAACGAGAGTAPPTALPNTSTPLSQPSRAFWRGEQVWVSLYSGTPTQVTHIAYPAGDNTTAVPGALRWSPGGRYLAFSYAIAPNDAAESGFARLGMIDTMTGSVTYPALPGVSVSIAGLTTTLAVNVWVRGGYGWSDVTTLMVAGFPAAAQGAELPTSSTTIYAVNATSGASSPIAGLQRLHIGALVVRPHTIYFSAYVGESTVTGSMTATLHRFDVVGNADSTLVTLGMVSTPPGAALGPLVGAFDISATGETMVYQRIDALDATGSAPSVSATYVLAGTDGSRPQAVLAGLAADHHGGAVELALAPDGSRVAAATATLVATDNAAGTDYQVLTPADMAATVTYQHIVWNPDSSSFTMDRQDSSRDGGRIFTIQPLYALYLSSATLLSWWPEKTRLG